MASRSRALLATLAVSGALLIVVGAANLLEPAPPEERSPPRPAILEVIDAIALPLALVAGALMLLVALAGLAGADWVLGGPQIESPAKERIILAAMAAFQAFAALLTARLVAVVGPTYFWRGLPVASLPFVTQATLPLLEAVLLAVALVGAVATLGLWLGRAWGWWAGLFAGGVGLVNLPVGTLVGAFLLWGLHRDRTAFLGRDRTAAEARSL